MKLLSIIIIFSAKEFASSMNKSVDPCDDFYDYVCGGWKGKLDMIPPYEGSWGRTELFQLTVNKRIRGMLMTCLRYLNHLGMLKILKIGNTLRKSI